MEARVQATPMAASRPPPPGAPAALPRRLLDASVRAVTCRDRVFHVHRHWFFR